MISLGANRVTAVDPNLNMLTIACSLGVSEGIDFQPGSYESLENVHGPFDLITGFFSFHLVHPEKRNDAIERMLGLLANDGQIALVYPHMTAKDSHFHMALKHANDSW